MSEQIYQIPVLITQDYLKEYSPIPNNFDWQEIKPFVPIAEEIHIVPIIGRQLYQELLEQVRTNTVTDVNSTLLLKIYQLEAIVVCVEALPFITYHFTEKGITKGKSDNSETIELNELTELTSHLESQISVFKTMLKDFLTRNADCYPLYQVENCSCELKNQELRLYPSSRKKDLKNF